MPELFGLCVKAETKNKVKSIEISLEQTAADEVKDQYANEYGICIHDTNEWLLVSSEGTITYNRRIAHAGRVSLQYKLKDTVAEFLKVYDDQSVFSHPKGHSPDTVQDEVRKTYRIVVTRDSGDTSVLEGSFDKDGLPDNWADFVDHIQKLCGEYNGVAWHGDDEHVVRDRFKFEAAHKAGYTMIRIQEPGLEVLDPKYDIVMPEGFCRNHKYDAKIMEEVGRKVIHLLEEIYGRKASPEIWALNNFKEFEVWYDTNKKELEANARKKGPKGKTAAKKAA